jgi:hypothetical protein
MGWCSAAFRSCRRAAEPDRPPRRSDNRGAGQSPAPSSLRAGAVPPPPGSGRDCQGKPHRNRLPCSPGPEAALRPPARRASSDLTLRPRVPLRTIPTQPEQRQMASRRAWTAAAVAAALRTDPDAPGTRPPSPGLVWGGESARPGPPEQGADWRCRQLDEQRLAGSTAWWWCQRSSLRDRCCTTPDTP